MTKAFNIYFTILLTMIVFNVGAFDKKTEAIDNKTKSKNDTTLFIINQNALMSVPEIESFDDLDNIDVTNTNLMQNYDPTFDYYGIWDTISVNPYKINLTQKTDTTYISLQDSLKCDYYHPFNGYVTSHFGQRGRYRYHLGIDINLETGDTVRCAFEGTVRISRRSSTFGNVVMVRHKNGLETIYAHLSRLNVTIGQHVEAGDILGLGGSTGMSTGSHLHFEVRYKGYALDPELLIAFNDFKLKTDRLSIDKNTFNYVHDFTKYKGKSRYYVVHKGDSLALIAKKNKVSISTLCKVNSVNTKTVLKAGRRLRIT